MAIAGLHASLEERMTYLKEMQITFWTEKRNDGVSDTTVEEDFRSDSVFTRTSGKSRRNRVLSMWKAIRQGKWE